MSEKELNRLWTLIDKRDVHTANLTVKEQEEYDYLTEKYDELEARRYNSLYPCFS